MRTDEELIADRNIRVVAQALLDTIDVLCHVYGCENKYIRDLGNTLFEKYGEQLKDIVDNGDRI